MSDRIDEYGDLDETAIFQALDDHIDSKTNANRAKDREALPELHELRKRQRGK